MDSWEAEKIINRIVSGTIRCKVKDIYNKERVYLIKGNNRYQKYLASELYQEFYDEALDYGLYDTNEYNSFLLENNLWLPDKEAKIKSLNEDIEELKVRMFSNSFNSQTMNTARKVLVLARNDLNKLYQEKNSYNHLSAMGFAEAEKNKFLLGMSLYKNDSPVLTERSYWRFPYYILSQVISIFRDTRLTESQFRWLARNEPWRSFWIAKKTESNLLNIPAVDMDEQQRTLVIWSNVYDNVYEHPEQPSQAVINDDDMLDGWFIVQRRKREKELNVSEANQVLGNEKIKNAGEVFLPASSQEDLKKISDLNDIQADLAKRQRFKHIEKHGVVTEANLPDVRMEIQQQYNKMFADKVKGKE